MLERHLLEALILLFGGEYLQMDRVSAGNAVDRNPLSEDRRTRGADYRGLTTDHF